MSVSNLIHKWFKDWTLFERIWLLFFTAINVALSFVWGDSLLGFISALSGMLCVVLVAKGKISNYYWGILQASTYAYIAFGYQLYGDAMLNAFFYFPTQFIGIYLWSRSRNKTEVSVKGEDIKARRLDTKQWVYTLTAIVVGTVVYAFLLKVLGGRAVGIDSATNILSIAAQILMLKRFAEQWLIWIAVNILSIIMWAIALNQTGGGDYSMLVMWSAFLVNSVYGYINWTKMSKAQGAVKL